jgi:hypothetical protein
MAEAVAREIDQWDAQAAGRGHDHREGLGGTSVRPPHGITRSKPFAPSPKEEVLRSLPVRTPAPARNHCLGSKIK